MARPLRIEHVGAWYHVTARGNERRAVFRDERDRRHFLELLAEMAGRFGVEVCGYALMENHYHLLLRLREKHLSLSLQWLNLSYAAWFNRRHDRSGHLFQGRFKSIIFDPAGFALALSRYVHLNPVRVAGFGLGKRRRAAARLGVGGAPTAAQLRERLACLRQYRWSSYRAYIGAEIGPPWLHCDTILGMNRGSQRQRQQAYRQYVEAALREGATDLNVWAELKENCVLGGARFLVELRAHITGHTEEQTAAARLRRPRVSWDEIVAATEEVTGQPWEALREKHGDLTRDLALYLGRRVGALKLKDLAQTGGLKSYAAAAMAIRRYGRRIERDKRERRRLRSVQQKLNLTLKPHLL